MCLWYIAVSLQDPVGIADARAKMLIYLVENKIVTL
jgi:hypothetical protein